MWLCDLEKAVSEIHQLCPNYVITKVVPAGSGIAFFTSHFSRILWCGHGGQIIERYEDGEEKIIRNFVWREQMRNFVWEE